MYKVKFDGLPKLGLPSTEIIIKPINSIGQMQLNYCDYKIEQENRIKATNALKLWHNQIRGK